MEQKKETQSELRTITSPTTPDTRETPSYEVDKNALAAEEMQKNIAYIRAQNLSQELEDKAVKIAESGIGVITIDYNANEPQIMVDTVFNKSYNASDLIITDDKVIPADWNMAVHEFNGDYMETYTQQVIFREINNSTFTKVEDNAHYTEPTTIVEELKDSMGVVVQPLGSNDFIDGVEVHYEDLSGESSVVPKESVLFNIVQDNPDVYVPYSHTSQESNVVASAETGDGIHTVNNNPTYLSNDTIEADMESTKVSDIASASDSMPDKVMRSTDFQGCSSDLDPANRSSIHAENPFVQNELIKNEETLAEIASVPSGRVKDTEAVPYSDTNPTFFFNPDGTVDAARVPKTKDTIDTQAPEESKFNTSGNTRQNEAEVGEVISQKSVLRQFKGHNDTHYTQYFMSIGSAGARTVKGSVVQGDESPEIEAASKIMREAHDIFAYCDLAAGTTVKNLLLKQQARLEHMTVDAKAMLDSSQISFADLSSADVLRDKLDSLGLRKSHVRKMLAVREQIVTNLKAQEALYQFATESNKFTPEQLALLKNNEFFNDIKFSSKLSSLYSTFFKSSDNEMLKKLDPASMSRRDLLRFDKNVQRAEHLYQHGLKNGGLSDKDQAFVDAYRLKEHEKAVYDKMKSERLSHTNKKGVDKISRMKGRGKERFRFVSGRLRRSMEKKMRDHAEGKMLRVVNQTTNTARTIYAVSKVAIPLAGKTAKKTYKVAMTVTKPVRFLSKKFIIAPLVKGIKDFAAVTKTSIQQTQWYRDKQRQHEEKQRKKAESEKGQKRAEQKKQHDAKKAETKSKRDAKNKDKRAKKEKRASKKNAMKSKLGKLGKILSAPKDLITLPFRGVEEIISWIANKIKTLLIVPAFFVLLIGVPIFFFVAMLSRTGGSVENPFAALYNEYILAGNDEDGVNYVYKWNEMMEEWQTDVEDDIHEVATHAPHTCNDRGIFGKDKACSICGAFILDLNQTKDAEGLKNEEVYYDTKIYAYGSPRSYTDPTADWYHNSGANIDEDLLNGVRIYYLNGNGEVIASSTTNIKDLLCLMTVWRQNLFTSNDYYDPNVEPEPDKVNKTVKKTLEWLWDNFQPIITTKVSSVYHTEYSTDTFPKNGDSYKCTDKNFYKKYDEAVAENVRMYDFVAPQQKETPSVEGYNCSGKGCAYTEWYEWELDCGLREHSHSNSCYSTERYLSCSEDHTHTGGCYTSYRTLSCGRVSHTHSAVGGSCYRKEYYREYYCPGHEALHCSYGYRDLNVYVTTFKIGDIIKLMADDETDPDLGIKYATFTNTLLNKKLGVFEDNPVKDYEGFPYTVFKDNSAGSSFTNRKEWNGDTYLYFSVPAAFSRDDATFNSSLKSYRRTIDLKDAYDKGYISRKFFYESIANLTDEAIDAEFDGFNVFDYIRHQKMSSIYGLESNMGFKICPDAEFHSEARQEGGGISETGCTGTIEWLYRLYSADWMAGYGIDSYGITSIEGNGSLNTEDIDLFMTQLDTMYAGTNNLSYQRKQLVKKALDTVGKIPYWAGGTPTTKYYNSRWGRTAVSSDEKYDENIAAGRTSYGLDAMGYFRYIYWSNMNVKPATTPKQFAASSGLQEVSYVDLKPGDIGFVNPITADFNVIGIFVGYKNGTAQWVYMDKAAGTVVLTNGGSVSTDGTQGSFAYFYKFMN